MNDHEEQRLDPAVNSLFRFAITDTGRGDGTEKIELVLAVFGTPEARLPDLLRYLASRIEGGGS